MRFYFTSAKKNNDVADHTGSLRCIRTNSNIEFVVSHTIHKKLHFPHKFIGIDEKKDILDTSINIFPFVITSPWEVRYFASSKSKL